MEILVFVKAAIIVSAIGIWLYRKISSSIKNPDDYSVANQIHHVNTQLDEVNERTEQVYKYAGGGNVDFFRKQYNIISLDYYEHSILAILHYKQDEIYYVTIINQHNGEIESEFSLDISFSSFIIDYLAPNGWGRILEDYYPNYSNNYNSNLLSHHSRELENLFFFKLNIDRKQIILFGRVFSYTNGVSKSNNFDEYSFEVYSFQGKQEFQKTFVKKDLSDAAYFSDKLLIKNNPYVSELEVFSFKTEESLYFNLFDAIDEVTKKQFHYEYTEVVTPLNSNLFGFICQNPTYGVQGVKVMQIDDSKNLTLIYDLDDLQFDGTFQNLTFNYKGDGFTVLEYRYPENFNILVYSLSDTKKKPTKIIETPYNHYDDSITYSQYLSNEKLAIVKSNIIIIYNLKSGERESEIERDLISPYFISENSIWYCFQGKLILHTDN